ncbi:hypothetical protein [Bacillus halotolerans]|uniref:hypothetical protein n=1 Tax=Bacillus halotolerans TaxID=260554 RepID=UPI002DB7B9D1|nr:hypothetical protein [Bacillus halotolerans]MEC1661946.1 hypothetical protein [Bacillus halotolerans]
MSHKYMSKKLTDEDFNLISNNAYKIGKYHVGETIEVSNGENYTLSIIKKQKRALTLLLLFLVRITVILMKANTLKKSKTPSSHTADQNLSALTN